MKRIITIAAIIMAAAIPIAASAQTPDYYGYEGAEKTVLIQWVKEAIDANNITFTTTAAKTNFLGLCSALETYASQSNWTSCVTTSNNLKTAASYINGADIKALVEDCCDATAGAFGSSEDLCMSSSDHDDTREALENGNLMGWSGGIYIKHFEKEHDCKYEDKGGGKHHLTKCEYRLIWWINPPN
ncbi:hypothetical protein GX441_12710 [bacterium]|nr:hypothetical protein [bacterium]